MTGSVVTALVALGLAVVVAWAVRKIVRKARRGGGCCGEHEDAVRGVAVKDRDRSRYPHAVDLKISGMTCSNCARRVEGALNSLDGTWASVDKNADTAHVLLKQEPDVALLCAAVARVGYLAEIL